MTSNPDFKVTELSYRKQIARQLRTQFGLALYTITVDRE